MSPEVLYHGGAGGLRVGDLIKPNIGGRHLDGCAICEARANGLTVMIGSQPVDGPTGHADRVYVTPHRLYAKHYASLAGRGWLYRVAPVGVVERSSEDMIEAYTCVAARVVKVIDKATVLTMTERRRLWREMGGTTREFEQTVADLPRTMRKIQSAVRGEDTPT